MSLKPLCKTPEDLSKFSTKEFKAKFFKAVKKLAKKHHSPETAAPFYLSTEEKLADASEAFIMIFGKFSKWKNYAKAKAIQTLGVRGSCFVTQDPESNALIINLMPVAGKLKNKEVVIAKALKPIVSPSRCKIKILPGVFTDELLDELEAKTEAMEETEDIEDTDTSDNDIADNSTTDTDSQNTTDDSEEKQIEDILNDTATPNKNAEALQAAQQKQLNKLQSDIDQLNALLSEFTTCTDRATFDKLDREIFTILSTYTSKKTA